MRMSGNPDPQSKTALAHDMRLALLREENREYIRSYNLLIERAGVFGEEFQDWDDPPPSPQSR